MSAIPFRKDAPIWRPSPDAWLAFGLMAVALWFFFEAGIRELVDVWERRPEYSFGFMIPPIVAFLVWQRKDILEQIRPSGSWWGIALVSLGIVFRIFGDVGVSFQFVEFGFVLALYGFVLAYLGIGGFRVILIPMLMLLLMMPLPDFFVQSLSQQLQLLSSSIGVSLIRLCEISVHQDGNVIDLGAMKLQVAEACSGLRYLFPLMTLGAIAAYFFQGAWWKRVIIFLSTIPITVLMNSLRIGLIGITVEYWGREMAEGFLHDFEGWFIFMACTLVLIGEMAILARIGPHPVPLRTAFGLEFPAERPAETIVGPRKAPIQAWSAIALLLIATAIATLMPPRKMEVPERAPFASFPASIEGWEGHRRQIEAKYQEVLLADDVLLMDYINRKLGASINLHSAYFERQTRGAAVHSPRNCIPGGGWEIASMGLHEVPGVNYMGQPLRVNRAVITKAQHTQLVYYWFPQRGRSITHEYAVKYYIFLDSFRRQRSDGAMVRLTTPIRTGERLEDADARLADFAALVVPQLGKYVPD